MDIYVVLNCWIRDASVVIGAAAEWDGAEAIANRTNQPAPRWGQWRSSFKVEGDPDAAMTPAHTKVRDALNADGTIHSSLYQQIVIVPLAGAEGGLWRALGYATEGAPPAFSRGATTEVIREAAKRGMDHAYASAMRDLTPPS